MDIIEFVENFNVISLAIGMILTACLYFGVSWVRYFFAISATLGVIIGLITLATIFTASAPIPIYLILYTIFISVYSLFVAIVLFKSEAVSEFLYSQETSR